MATIVVSLDGSSEVGGTPLLMHNERLADPLNDYAKAVAVLSGKRKKTEADHLEIARLEFVGCLYYDEDLGPVIPSWNVVRMIQEGGKRHKLGANVLRGLIPTQEFTALQYEGPRGIEELWKDGRFALRKGVGISGRRVMRTRPCFTDWSLEVPLELDLTILDVDKIDQLVFEAGKYEGLCDGRPQFGRCFGKAALHVETSANGKAKKEVAA